MNREQWWQAVLQRDMAQDGKFVFAVKSTGIYCRPGCPARRPNRNQVLFYDTPVLAEKAGYRPCRRCRPKDANVTREKILQSARYIETHLENALDLTRLSRTVGLNPYYYQRIFQKIMGLSPKEYTDICRFKEFKKQLTKTKSVTEALYAAGYGSSSRLYERTSSRMGMTPVSYRKGGQGLQIEYTIVSCSLGRMLLAVTPKGVCSTMFGDNQHKLEELLKKEFSKARITRNDKALKCLTQPILVYLNGKNISLNLPLDIQATVFQWKVWEILRSIPKGETRSYQEIARRIKKPKAFRAIARACATNPTALLIPCHRIIRTDGHLGGYRWGLKTKKNLLIMEKNFLAKVEDNEIKKERKGKIIKSTRVRSYRGNRNPSGI